MKAISVDVDDWTDFPVCPSSQAVVPVGLAVLTLGLLVAVVGPVVLRNTSGGLSSRDSVILAGALIGVSGSYYVYRRRRQDARDRLRSAMFAELALVGDEIHDEIRDMAVTELRAERYVPDESPIVVTVYENNAEDLGRLTEHEIECLASFYTFAAIVEPRMERVTRGSDVGVIEVTLLRHRLIELYNRRNRALRALERELDGTPTDVEHAEDVEEGDVLEEVADAVGVHLEDAD